MTNESTMYQNLNDPARLKFIYKKTEMRPAFNSKRVENKQSNLQKKI